MKPFYFSKIFWLFGLLALGAIANSLFQWNLPLVTEAEWVIWSLTIVAFLLRFITKEPISWDGIGSGKPFWQSRTFWIFALLAIAGIINKLGWLNLEINENAAWLLTVIPIISVILRFFTGSQIEGPGDNPYNFRTIILFAFLLGTSLFMLPGNSSAQVYIVNDSVKYQDSIYTIDASGHKDLYLDLKNYASDSSVTVYLYSLDPKGDSTAVGLIDVAGSSTATVVTSVTLTVGQKKRYKIFGEHYRLLLFFSPSEGINSHVKFVFNAFTKLQF